MSKLKELITNKKQAEQIYKDSCLELLKEAVETVSEKKIGDNFFIKDDKFEIYNINADFYQDGIMFVYFGKSLGEFTKGRERSITQYYGYNTKTNA